jgi:hypothetical protein
VPQNHRDGFFVWASKSSGLRFIDCATKPTGGATAWDTHRDLVTCFRVEASQARVSQPGLKTGGGVMADGAHGIIAEVAWR